MNRTKKLILAFLGLALLIAAQALTNIYVFDKQQEYTMAALPIWFVVYFTYSQLVITKI